MQIKVTNFPNLYQQPQNFLIYIVLFSLLKFTNSMKLCKKKVSSQTNTINLKISLCTVSFSYLKFINLLKLYRRCLMYFVLHRSRCHFVLCGF